jgi:hypothetical protein
MPSWLACSHTELLFYVERHMADIELNFTQIWAETKTREMYAFFGVLDDVLSSAFIVSAHGWCEEISRTTA